MFLAFLLVLFKFLIFPIGLIDGFSLGAAIFPVLLSVLECQVAFFYALPPHRRFLPELETCVTHFYMYSFLLPADLYYLIDASLSDFVPSLSFLPIPWLFLVHIVIGCCFLSFPFCRLTRGIPATLLLDSAFCRSLVSPFTYGSAPFLIYPHLFRVIFVPGSASIVYFIDSFLFLCFLIIDFLF